MGGDGVTFKNEETKKNFNSRLRVGGDVSQSESHALESYFNSRLRVGGDLTLLTIPLKNPSFQFTPPRGRRRRYGQQWRSEQHFNSRLRVGGDPARFIISAAISYFNSRLRVGGDSSKQRFELLPHCYFNSRLRVGGDYCRGSKYVGLTQISIHASAWEATDSYI